MRMAFECLSECMLIGSLIRCSMRMAFECLSECMLIGSLIRCAFILAVVTLFAALYSHPWYVVLWSDRNYTLDEVIGFEGAVVPAWVYATHQRYFFFQQWSTAGALLQLVVFGPGRLSLDEAVHGETSALHAMEAKATD